MEAMAYYLLKSSVWLTGFALVYFLFLRNERFFVLNRIYLVTGIFVSLLFPLITIRYAVLLPVSTSVEAMSPIVNGVVEEQNPSFSVGIALLSIYAIGLLYFAWRIYYQTHAVVRVIQKAEVNRLGSVRLIKSAEYSSSFSFFSFVFVNPSTTDAEANEIVNHESEHVRQQHWFDLLFVELLCMVQWFNPLVWLYSRFIRQNHEYLADKMALQRTSDPAIYRAALLNQMFGGPVVSLANSFNYSLNKKRFNMMKKTITSPFRKAKILLVLPVVAMVFYAFAKPEYIAPEPVKQVENVAVADQGDVVKGKVVNPDGNPLAGTSVIISGTTVGTITDNNGDFMLKDVPAGAEIVFSFVGFVSIKQKADFDKPMQVKLQKGNVGIDGVVVVGYGVKDANNKTPPSGVKVRTLDSENPPLILLDGVEIDKSKMDQIDPETIESISVLKNESAKATYGEKGKNGVIVITSKGKSTPQEPQKPKEPVKSSKMDKSGAPVFVIVEEMPEFPGGQLALRKFVASSVKYPVKAREADAQGKVFVTFVVNSEGNVEDAKIARSVQPDLDAEALRVVNSLPTWSPGKQRGQAVAVSYTIPIEFKLE